MVTNLLTWAGSLLVVGSAVLHFDLWWHHGYRNIPTIGPLFLAQAVVGVLLALWTSVSRKLLLLLAEAGFALSTAGGLIISVNFSLFNWQETMSGPSWLSLAFEFAAAAVLLSSSVLLALSMAEAARARPAGVREPKLPA